MSDDSEKWPIPRTISGHVTRRAISTLESLILSAEKLVTAIRAADISAFISDKEVTEQLQALRWAMEKTRVSLNQLHVELEREPD